MYFEDGFQKPAPFRPDVAVSIDDVFEKKIDMLDAHVSQMYEWLPWVDGTLEKVPEGSGGAKSAGFGETRDRSAERRGPGGAREMVRTRRREARSRTRKPSKSASTARGRTRR